MSVTRILVYYTLTLTFLAIVMLSIAESRAPWDIYPWR